MSSLYAELAIPVSIDKLFTYSVPNELQPLAKSRSKRTMIPFLLTLMLVFHCLTFSTKPTGPLRVFLSATRRGTDSMQVHIRCLGNTKFTAGALNIGVHIFPNRRVDSTRLWSGKSDTGNLDRTFNYTIKLAEGKKCWIVTTFEGRVKGIDGMYAAMADLAAYQFPDTLLQADGEYSRLDWAEIDYLIQKKGYGQKTEDEIGVIDPKFWERIMQVKHGHLMEKK